MAEKPHKTLGRNVIPSNYRLSIEPDMRAFRHKGRVEISVSIKKPARTIRMNSKELKIKAAHLLSKGARHYASIKLDKKEETLTLSFDRQVAGAASIVIDFEGANSDEMYGLYRSRYTVNGKDEYMLTSQFESTDARSAFPCLDEPEFKATFDLEVVIDEGLDAVSNMPVRSEGETAGGKKRVAFSTTPRMSPYLLYIGIGKFEFLCGRAGSLPVRIVTVPGKIAYAGIALEFAKKFVGFYEKYFGVKYPLPKLDLIAVPDFAAGAMENWGAITFREVAILGNERVTSVAARRRIAEVIAHEITHQWFGDLVTMEWWDDLWLNESFANFMSYKAVDAVFPEWRMGTQYFLDTVGTAFSVDQLKSTHPISVHVNEPGEITDIFDEISYEKGGSVLQMLEDYVGEAAFRKGLSNYLKRHAYGNATKYDLWNAIERASGPDGSKVSRVASYWIDNPGYPIIEVKTAKGVAALEQKRFLLLGGKGKGVWPVPLHYKSDGKIGFMLLDRRRGKIRIGKARYVKLNHLQKGLYRVRYPDGMLEVLGGMIKAKKLSALDAWGVENDLCTLARSCRIPLKRYLDFVERYCSDSGYPLNFSVSQHLYGLSVMTHGKKPYDSVIRLSAAYHGRILKRIGWRTRKSDDDITKMLRSVAIRSMGMTGDRTALNRASAMFRSYVTRRTGIDPNIRGAVYTLSAWGGGMETFNRLVRLYKKEQLPEERSRLLSAIGNFSSPAISKRALRFSLSKYVRLQDTVHIPSVTASNYVGKGLIWGWTRANWADIAQKFKEQRMLGYFVDNLSVIGDAATGREIARFFARKENWSKEIERSLAQALECIDMNVKFRRSLDTKHRF